MQFTNDRGKEGSEELRRSPTVIGEEEKREVQVSWIAS